MLLQTNEEYQYTSTEFEWLLDVVNYTLQVKLIEIFLNLLTINIQDETYEYDFHANSSHQIEEYQPLWEFWIPGDSFFFKNIFLFF